MFNIELQISEKNSFGFTFCVAFSKVVDFYSREVILIIVHRTHPVGAARNILHAIIILKDGTIMENRISSERYVTIFHLNGVDSYSSYLRKL
jgi:hypothetical protein